MIIRRSQATVERQLRLMPGVVLLGPRQVGKTTLAKSIADQNKRNGALYLDMERPTDLRRLADADAFLREHSRQLVIIDEIHRVPELFGVLRGIIDDRRSTKRRNGHFLLLGSASIELMRQASETLAGRVAYLDLAPLDAAEMAQQLQSPDRLWLRGGFPDSVLARNDVTSMNWRQAFIRSYLERDVPMFAPRLPAETVGRLWTMLAYAQGSMLNQSRLASSLAVSAPAIGRYIDLLVDLLLVRRLRPWSGNVSKRLVRTPKIYIRDSGLMHALLELDTLSKVLGHPVAGPSWEGFVIENLLNIAGDQRTPYYYRTEDGSEVDLVFERAGKVEMAIEIRRSTAPVLSRGFHTACEVLKPKHKYLVHSGTEVWPYAKGITAISLIELMQRLR